MSDKATQQSELAAIFWRGRENPDEEQAWTLVPQSTVIFNSRQILQTLPLAPTTNRTNKHSSGNNESCQSLVLSNPTYLVSVTLSINSKLQVSQRPGAGTWRMKLAGHKGAHILDRSSYCLSEMWQPERRQRCGIWLLAPSRGLRVHKARESKR